LVFLFRNWLLQALAPSLLHADRLTGLEFIAIALALIWRRLFSLAQAKQRICDMMVPCLN